MFSNAVWRNSRALRAALIAALWFGAQASQAANPTGLGVNLGEWAYWSPDLPMIDQFKRASGWYTQRPIDGGGYVWDTHEQAKLKLDANGWVAELPRADDANVQFRWAAAFLFQNNGGAHPAGVYTVLYEGEGRLEYTLLGEKDRENSKPNRDLVYVKSGSNDGLLIQLQATNPSNPLRNIRVLPPGGVCEAAPKRYVANKDDCVTQGSGRFINFEELISTQRWHPYFVADLKGFRDLRFLDWAKTNTSTLQRWSTRPKMSDAFWSGPSGIPLEAMLDLADRSGTDPWINIPFEADDDYVRRFARLAKARLNPKRRLIVEYSNEPWNGRFEAGAWMEAKALERWQGGTQSENFGKRLSWYGMRSVQVCALVKAEFAADASRVKCAINSQADNADVARQILDCPYAAADMGGKPCGTGVDVLAIAPYFGGYIGDPSVRSTVDAWARDADGGMAKMFAEILGEDAEGRAVKPPLLGLIADSVEGGALERIRQKIVDNANMAASKGLPLWAYEGGQHLTTANDADFDATWIALFTAANRHPRMGQAYQRLLQQWSQAGGQDIALFNHIYQPSRSGAWGLKETQFSETGVKWNAILPWRNSAE